MRTPASNKSGKRASNTENVKPHLKRKATIPPQSNDSNGRIALRNISNQSKLINKETSKQTSGVKKIPNYLRPTFSTQQKCVEKKIKPSNDKPCAKKELSTSSVPKVENHKNNSEDQGKVQIKRASENFYDFDEDVENQESQTLEKADLESKSEQKGEKSDFASPLRIELVPVRKIIPSTPKPPVDQVLSILKSSLSSPLVKTPRTVERKLPQFFKTLTPSSSVQAATSPAILDDDLNETFDCPPRRSYSRPRPLMNLSVLDEPSSDEEDKEDKIEVKVPQTKEPKNNPKKRRKTNKTTAQDKQFEELAAAMNSEFSQVEGFQLVVE